MANRAKEGRRGRKATREKKTRAKKKKGLGRVSLIMYNKQATIMFLKDIWTFARMIHTLKLGEK